MTNQQANLDLLDTEVSRNSSTASGSDIVLCVACCAPTPQVPGTVRALVAAFSSEVTVRPVVLAESEWASSAGQDVAVQLVPTGTKLSKLRLLADMKAVDLVCICDPDLMIEPDGCREILRVAMSDACEGKEVLAFGIVDGHDDGTLLSQLGAMDKWLSHRVVRRFLWWAQIGITIPGQFFIVSKSLLSSLKAGVDCYLDDLYLGLIARERGVRVLRVPILVGKEEPRSCWWTLLTQRIRWMKGLTCLVRRLISRPSAVMLLLIHYIAYHGFPILIGLGIGLLAIINPIAAAVLFVALAAALSMCSRRPLLTACCYLAVFPCLHLAATFLFWLPLGKSLLQRR